MLKEAHRHKMINYQRKTFVLLYLYFAAMLDFGTGQLTQPKPIVENNWANMLVRLNNNRRSASTTLGPREGRVEVSFDFGESWGTICSSRWSFREGNVVCRQLNLGHADMANMTTQYGTRTEHPWKMVGTLCRGNENSLANCTRESRYPETVCTTNNSNVATVRCVERSPDLSLGLREIETSVRLDAVPMSRITCAMEEKCVSRDAYVIRRTQPHAVRLLLRFTTKAENVGTADLSPYTNYDQWQWHQCHNHYHSMEVFATFDIYNKQYRKMAEGHKASFCLMDTMCMPGVRPRYTCGNVTQGISVGCSDLYSAGLDCQWVDVTNLPRNQQYILRVALNPLYQLGEISFENNGVECILHYTGNSATTRITRCSPTASSPPGVAKTHSSYNESFPNISTHSSFSSFKWMERRRLQSATANAVTQIPILVMGTKTGILDKKMDENRAIAGGIVINE